MKKFSSFVLMIFLISNIYSQHTYRSPLDIPLVLSANFGELRPHHFHTGIDLKTQGGVNKPVYSIEDGYVSRISVSPSGYGLAIYINHPKTGQTSVYGHLNKYASKIASYVKDKQNEAESFKVDLKLDEKIFPLKKGDLIAYSGNTGSSGGPHVHFEIRDTKTGWAKDPLPFYSSQIADSKAPLVKGIAIYPIEGKGAVSGSSSPYRQTITALKGGGISAVKKDIDAWGTIAFGIHTNDRMDNTGNIYGVKTVKLFCDDALIYSSDISHVDFDQSRMINSMTDFDYWSKTKTFYMRSFIEPGNELPLYQSVNNGYLTIDKEKVYDLRYELTDVHKNKTTYKFSIKGKKQVIPKHRTCSQAMVWDHNNHYITNDFSLIVPAKSLYNDICFVLNKKEDSDFLSKKYTVSDMYIPLNSPAQMKIALTKDTIAEKNQYGVIRIKDQKESWVGGEYIGGQISTKISDLGGEYAVSYDNEAPKIAPTNAPKWVSLRRITIKVTDNLSGIKSYRGTIDDKYALFENDVKSTNYTYSFDTSRLEKGKKHRLKFTATDSCGNMSVYEYEFTY